MAEAGPKLLRGLLEVFLLESLEQQPKHGYALLKEMGEVFGSQPNRNRLYPLLAKLVSDGYVREIAEAGGNRTLYALTDLGKDALHSYRRLPPQFRRALRRIWSLETHEDVTEREGEGDGEGEGTTTAPREIPVIDASTRANSSRSRSSLPYPCPDAKVEFAKESAAGDLRLRLTGCPMGAYEYCPECPIFQGLSRLVLTSSTKG